MIELYYNEQNDALIMVEGGIIKYYDENINSCEFLSYFNTKDITINNINDLKKLSKEDILTGYKYLITDCKNNCGESELQRYFEFVRSKNLEGKIVIRFE